MAHDDAMPSDSSPPPVDTDGPVGSTREGNAAIRRAEAAWMRRGYRVRYRDAYLIQLIRRRGPGLRSSPFLALALVAAGVALAAWIAVLRRRPWHVVTLVIGPDNRILTHHHTAPQPPAP